MAIITLGLNHNTAPISVRERLVFPTERMIDALRKLARLPGIEEAAILSTCNRTEIYCGSREGKKHALIDWIAEEQQLRPADFQPYLYSHCDSATIRHMFRVASGLDSMVLGEPQILGQMKTAYQAASEAGTLGKTLGKLFQHTFTAAKKVRTDTAIGSSPVSVAFAAVRLAKRIFEDLGQQTAILIGAGETIELTARHLAENRIGELIIANRTYDRAHALAQQFNGFAISLAELPMHLARADIVVSSTASQLPILGKGSVETAIKARRHKPVFMVDLAVPRDIEPEVAALQDIYLYTVDDLADVVQTGQAHRQAAVAQAEAIIDAGVQNFVHWLDQRSQVPLIRELNAQAEAWQAQEVAKAQRQLARGEPVDAVLAQLARSMSHKMLHGALAELHAGDPQARDRARHAIEHFFLRGNR